MPRVNDNPHESTLFAQNLSDQKAEAELAAKQKAENDMKQWPLMKRMQYLKVWLWRQGLKKTGENTYNKFKYFQLPDFLPQVNEKLFELDIYSQFVITPPVFADGVEIEPEMAMLSLMDVNGNGHVTVKAPTKENTMGSNPIQNEGGKHTYMHRYLWIDLLGLAEGDEIDEKAGFKPEKEQKAKKAEIPDPNTKPCTPVQIDVIKTILTVEEIEKTKTAWGLKSLSDLTMKQASDLIKKAKEKKGMA